MKDITLTLTPLELGYLVGSLREYPIKDMPSLRDKLIIAMNECYLDHPNLGGRAKQEIKDAKKRLKILERSI